MEIETQSGYKDHHQAYSAGLIEGSLTWMSIYAQWTNTIQAFCEKDDGNKAFCDWLRDIVANNYKNVLRLAKEKDKSDYYQHQVFLFYHQLLGMEIGFKKGVKRARQDYELDIVDFLLLNSRVDIEDLKIYYNEFVTDDVEDSMNIHPRVAKMILKIMTEDGEHPKVYVGQSSDGDYSSMLKIVKTYRFNYHHGPEASSRLVTNTDITFTSYPGALASSDDFYLAEGKLSRIIVSGITLKHYHSAQLMHGIDLEGTIFSSARVMAANRLSYNGKYWSRIMAKDPDIGIKQWLVIDEKRVKFIAFDSSADVVEAVTSPTTNDENYMSDNEVPTDSLKSADFNIKSTPPSSNRNLVWLIDQTYKRLHAEDVTASFRAGGSSWGLDGTPYFKVIQELNGLQPRTLELKRNLTTLDDVAHYLRQKSYRGDLLSNPTTFGNFDIKLYTSENQELIIQNGPVTSNSTQPFDWSDEDFKDKRHQEHPQIWDFSPIQVQYVWD